MRPEVQAWKTMTAHQRSEFLASLVESHNAWEVLIPPGWTLIDPEGNVTSPKGWEDSAPKYEMAAYIANNPMTLSVTLKQLIEGSRVSK